MNTYTKTFLICPHCNQKTDTRICHLDKGQRFGPWECDQCGHYFEGIANKGDTVLRKSPDQGKTIDTLDLLVLLPRPKPVYFVLNGKICPSKHDDAFSNDHHGHKEYFYEEHSCPTNWIGETTMISDDGDTDPHGILKFIRFVERPADMPESGMDEDAAIIALFPEIQA